MYMEIEIFDRKLGSFDVMEDFHRKQLHLVCVAVNSFAIYNAFATSRGRISETLASSCSQTANYKNETETLFPELSITIVPLTKYAYRDNFGDFYTMSKHIDDCFKANEKYLKCEEMLFAFEDRDDFDYQLAMSALQTQASEKRNFVHTKRIFYVPYS